MTINDSGYNDRTCQMTSYINIHLGIRSKHSLGLDKKDKYGNNQDFLKDIAPSFVDRDETLVIFKVVVFTRRLKKPDL